MERCSHGATIFASSNATARSGLLRAHDTLNAYDPGGLNRSHSPGDHNRLAHGNLSTTGPGGHRKR